MEHWVIKNKKADFQAMVQQFGISEVIARCLVNRGLSKPEEIETFLTPGMKQLHNPFLMKGMKEAQSILDQKITQRKKIRIIGDYDVDGVVATYVLYQGLKLMGAQVDYEIPDRIKDGYGLNIQMIEDAQLEGIDTILTCDNGIVAMEQVLRAKEYGMTVIITDHHNLAVDEEGCELLPQADAILNPHQPGCDYPYPELCGAAVAYKLILALLENKDIIGKQSFEMELLSYVAIATVCDVMELTGENRSIVWQGIQLLKQTENKGLLALMDITGIEKEELSAFHLGFVIGPCLNASGRLDTAKKGLELLRSNTKEQAIRIATEVKKLNDLRKEMTAQNVEKAIVEIEGSSLKEDKILVVYLRDCHESIAGIIAGRIRERYNKPTIILTDSEECIKGSARSIEAYNIIEGLFQCKDLLLKVGGHPMAAGLSLQRENIEPLREHLNQNTTITDEMLVPKVTIDVLLPFGYVTESLINELSWLEPFGKGNEKPLFAEKDLIIKSARVIGKNKSGIRLRLRNQYGKEMEAIYFGDVDGFFSYFDDNYGPEESEKLRTGRSTHAKLTITYYPKINEYRGVRNVQLMIKNYR